jgi:hypothetical protein
MSSQLQELVDLEKEFTEKKAKILAAARDEALTKIDNLIASLDNLAVNFPADVSHAVSHLVLGSGKTTRTKATKEQMQQYRQQIADKLNAGAKTVKKTDFTLSLPAINKATLNGILGKMEEKKLIKIEPVQKGNPKLGSTITRLSKEIAPDAF